MSRALEPITSQEIPVPTAWETIHPALKRLVRPYPYDAIKAARVAHEEITPHLVDVLTQLAADPAPARDSDYMLHFYAICLLAEFREQSAYRPMIALAAQPEEIAEDLFGDFSAENLGRAIASVCDGDLTPIKALAENRQVNVWVRNAALDALVTRCLEGDADAVDIVAYIEQLGAREVSTLRGMAISGRDRTFLSCIVCSLCDIGPAPALASIREWYADELVDEMVTDLHDVTMAAQSSAANSWQRSLQNGKGYVRDAVGEMADWACFDETRDADEDEFDDLEHDEIAFPYVRETPKIGRNDPCLCGSGKKYKKCCLNA